MEGAEFPIRISNGEKERKFYVSKDMLVQDLCRRVCDFIGCKFYVDKCFLWNDTCQMKPIAALQVYDVSPNTKVQGDSGL